MKDQKQLIQAIQNSANDYNSPENRKKIHNETTKNVNFLEYNLRIYEWHQKQLEYLNRQIAPILTAFRQRSINEELGGLYGLKLIKDKTSDDQDDVIDPKDQQLLEFYIVKGALEQENSWVL